jgi:tetratricopeptide (TPR) repeat protein
MSLLLDARNKSQQAQAAQDSGRAGLELSLEALPDSTPAAAAATATATATATESARIAGQTLFSAKSPASNRARASINRNLLIMLGGTILLLAAGGGYVWYAIQPVHPAADMPPARPVPAAVPPKNNLVPDIAPTPVDTAKPAAVAQAKPAARPLVTMRRETHKSAPLLVEQQQDQSLDPILNQAYLAYRSGKFEQAERSYQQAYKLDASNMDAILGLAVISQRLGHDSQAAHYYAKALVLDPRNAVANAGMSAMTTDTNPESRLKTLLNEQPDSAALHFALGNQYAGQSRWGEAQQSYFNAYRLDPGNAQLAVNLAISLDHLGQKKPAAEYYQRALQLDPDQSAGFNHKQISQRIEDLTH